MLPTITSPVTMPMPTASGGSAGSSCARTGAPRVHLDRAADRVERHVRAGEVREHGVADELVDVAVEALHQVGLQLQIAVQHRHRFFRRALLGERREAADVARTAA